MSQRCLEHSAVVAVISLLKEKCDALIMMNVETDLAALSSFERFNCLFVSNLIYAEDHLLSRICVSQDDRAFVDWFNHDHEFEF